VKKLHLTVLALSLMMSVSSFAFAEEAASQTTATAYYFHGTYRCPTCTRLEKYAREAIETNFKDELSSGALTFKAVNTEEPGNEHFAKDYQLYTKSLVLSLTKDGEEIRSKNLDKIWQLVGNKQKFMAYVTAEVRAFLEEVS
jgi:hypothetical protein